jgi:hypothetical protein
VPVSPAVVVVVVVVAAAVMTAAAGGGAAAAASVEFAVCLLIMYVCCTNKVSVGQCHLFVSGIYRMHKMLTVIWELICKHFVIQILPCVLFS